MKNYNFECTTSEIREEIDNQFSVDLNTAFTGLQEYRLDNYIHVEGQGQILESYSGREKTMEFEICRPKKFCKPVLYFFAKHLFNFLPIIEDD